MKKIISMMIMLIMIIATTATAFADANVILGCNGVKVRTEATTDSPSLTTLREGTDVKIISIGEKWTRIRYKSIVGYVHNDFLSYSSEYVQENINAEDLKYLGNFEITAYTFSGCGKRPDDKYYGITADGTDLNGMDYYDDAWTIAVDPKVIPYGTRVYIDFSDDPERSKYTGIYTAHDCGGAGMKGKRIDIFMGEHEDEAAKEFGRQRKIKVYLID